MSNEPRAPAGWYIVGHGFSFVDTTNYPNERAANKRIVEINWRGVTPLLWDGEKWVDRLSAAIGELG